MNVVNGDAHCGNCGKFLAPRPEVKRQGDAQVEERTCKSCGAVNRAPFPSRVTLERRTWAASRGKTWPY